MFIPIIIIEIIAIQKTMINSNIRPIISVETPISTGILNFFLSTYIYESSPVLAGKTMLKAFLISDIKNISAYLTSSVPIRIFCLYDLKKSIENINTSPITRDGI